MKEIEFAEELYKKPCRISSGELGIKNVLRPGPDLVKLL
jgi:hypothetical protein